MHSLIWKIFGNVLISALWLGNVVAMTVDFTAQPGQRSVVNAASTAVAAGTFVWVGAVSDEAQISTGISYVSLRAIWLPFASTLTRTLGGEAGRFSASISSDEPDLEFAENLSVGAADR